MLKPLKLVALLLSLVMIVSGCDNANNNQTSKTEIIIGTSGSPSPFTTVNKQGELEGYDIDTVKAIFAELPQYSIKFEITEFSSVLAGLDSERYQVGANNYAMNEKRKEKYFYSDPIFINQYVIAAPLSSDIRTFDDLAGKRTEVVPGLNYATALERFNKDHPTTPVIIDYTEADLLPVLNNVETGKYDFQLVDRAMLAQFIEKYHLQLKSIELSLADSEKIGSPYSYLLISRGKKGEKLTQDINSALQKIIANGELEKISYRYFNQDFSPTK